MVYWGYNPFTNLVLTSWDILVLRRFGFPRFQRKIGPAVQNHLFESSTGNFEGEKLIDDLKELQNEFQGLKDKEMNKETKKQTKTIFEVQYFFLSQFCCDDFLVFVQGPGPWFLKKSMTHHSSIITNLLTEQGIEVPPPV